MRGEPPHIILNSPVITIRPYYNSNPQCKNEVIIKCAHLINAKNMKNSKMVNA